jgi:uncharacterized protein
VATPPYSPAWWLRGPHLQTLWGKFFRRVNEVPSRRIRWDTPDGDFLDLRRVDAPDGRPRMLLLHGLEGGEHSHYVSGVLADAHRRGWGADLMVFRSCGTEINRAPRFYHSGETGDLSFVLDRLLVEFPGSPFFLAGVSLGGNVLLKFLGEHGTAVSPRVLAAAGVSVPFDLGRSSRRIGHGFSRVYEAHFLRSLHRKAARKHAAFPEQLPAAAGRRARTLYQFDDEVTAPLHGFIDASDYYTQSSAIRWLPGITVSTLLLSARDDPFLPGDVLDEVREIARHNPALHVEFVDRGGHVGFIEGRVPWRPAYYLDRRLGEFFAQHVTARAKLPM